MGFASRAAAVVLACLAAGCMSPFHTDQGALFGGVTGAGVGALIGEASGNPAAGAVIGAGVGALTGAAVGSSLDEMEARHQAELEARLGRPAPAGAVTFQDVVMMTQAGVDDDLIMTHIQIHGVARPPQTQDLIFLKNSGVSARVIQALQTPSAGATVIYEAPPPILHPAPYPGPWFGPPPPRYRFRRYHGY